MQQNALSKFYRSPKLFIELPSGHERYTIDQVEFNESHEVGVFSMTLNDELLLKNPDALLNGEAVASVISNCVPAVKKPRELFAADIDALMVAIRIASFGKELDLSVVCPQEECKKKNDVSLNLEAVLHTAKKLPEVSVVNLENGLTVFLHPKTFRLAMEEFKNEFESKKFIKSVTRDSSTSEDEKVSKLSKAFEKIARSQADILVRSIAKIVKEDEGIDVSEYETIRGFVENTETANITKIANELDKLNKPAVNNLFKVKCQHCSHEWEENYDFNLTDFFTIS